MELLLATSAIPKSWWCLWLPPSSYRLCDCGSSSCACSDFRIGDNFVANVMDITAITLVERLEPHSDQISGFSIELPEAGTKKEGYSFELGGWVVANYPESVHIELVANDGPVRRIPILFPRPDVASAFPEIPATSKVGFYAPISVLGMTAEFDLLIQVVLQNTHHIPIGRIRGHHQAVRRSFAPTIQPLLVTSLGRTGTTLLMRVLSEHPSIAVAGVHPYEARPGRYWMQLLGAMAEPAYAAQSENKVGTLEARWWDSQDPFQRGWLAERPALQRWFTTRFVEQLASFCQRSIEDCYKEVAAAQGQRTPTYFAEKHLPDEVPGIFRELYPRAREIVVVRDFRDVLCSIRALNAKRGTQDFSRDLVASEEEYVHHLAWAAQALLRSWAARRDHTCLVRYEDLVLEPRQTLQRILGYLQLEDGDSVVEPLLRSGLASPGPDEHRTSANALASIGRWRNDLDAETQELCEELFGPTLEAFGYNLYPTGPAVVKRREMVTLP